MSTDTAPSSPSQRTAALTSVLLIVLLAIPAILTLCTVRHPNKIVAQSPDPTPYGYTVALLFWIIPSVAIAFWLMPAAGLKVPRKAYWITIALLLPIGFVGEFLFVHLFWDFPNLGATMRIMAPALYTQVPIEEYLFYIAAFICALLVYIWCDEYWLSRYQENHRSLVGITDFRILPLLIAAILIAAAVIYKKWILKEPGWPYYFVFQILAVQMPCVFFMPQVRGMINWRAFTVTYFFTVMVSMLWEATLAVPYQWWRYFPTGMVGIYIKAWNMPIEAVMLWLASTYPVVIIYHVVKLNLLSDEPVKTVLFGDRTATSGAGVHK